MSSSLKKGTDFEKRVFEAIKEALVGIALLLVATE